MKWLSVLLQFLLGIVAAVRAQDAEVERRAKQYSSYYEDLLTQTLSRYYHPGSFLVDARVTLAEMIQDLSASAAENAKTEDNWVGDGQNPDGLEALPGLPVLPEQMRGSKPKYLKDSLRSGAPDFKARRSLGIKYIDLTVMVDTVYTLADVEFILEVCRMVAKLEDFRGDRIQVRKKVFPRGDRRLEDYRVHHDTLRHPVEAMREDSARAAHPWSFYWTELPSLLPLLLILIFLTLIVYLIVKGLRSTTLPPELLRRIEVTGAQPVVASVSAPEEPARVAESGDDEQSRQLEILRSKVINALIGDPAVAGLVARNWMETDRDKAVIELAGILQALDARAADILRPHLEARDYQAVRMQVELGEKPDPETLIQTLRQFLRDYNASRKQSLDGTASDIFGFMHQLSTQQLLHILKDEPAGIVGLALAQIPGERAGLILQNMEPESRAQVLVSMGQIDMIPVQAYKEVANRLSRKALEVGNMRFVAADGVQTILDIVQGLGLQEQVEYLRSIAERDLNLASRLRRYYAVFEELPSLPETVLNKVLNTFDRDMLITALVGADTQYREQLLAGLPQRMRQMIESGIEGRLEQSPLETERARKALLAAVRKELQACGGRS